MLAAPARVPARRAKRILQQHESELHSLAQALLEKETLSGEQIHEMVRKREVLAGKQQERLVGQA